MAFYNPKTGVLLSDGWCAKWNGLENFILSKGTRRYEIYAPVTKSGLFKKTYRLCLPDMPKHWLPPHEKQEVTSAEMELMLNLASEAISQAKGTLQIDNSGKQ